MYTDSNRVFGKAQVREFTQALAPAKAGEACNTAENLKAKSIITY